MTTTENTITYSFLVTQFLMGPFKLNAYAYDQERVSWYVMVFSVEVN